MAHVAGFGTSSTASRSRRPSDIGGQLPAQTINVLWDVVAGGPDHITSQSESERNQFTSLGQTWYVFTNQLSGTQPLYRLIAGSDHMDSILAGEGGYSTEETLGNGFTSSGAPGVTFMQRSYNSGNHDHDTQVPGQVLAGYSAEPLGIYGYPRYGTQSTSLTTITANNVTATVNAVAGGAFWSWTWSGNQFLNTADNGREMQSAFYYGYHTDGSWTQNPTEAGDWVTGNAQDRHGSPVISTSISGTVISTRAVPLEWNSPPPDPQVNSDRATIYKDVIIGKNVDLNFYNMPGIASYTTVLTLPNAVSGASLEMPTAYLNAMYDHFWAYDAKMQHETAATPTPCVKNVEVNSGQYLPSGYGGVIIGKGDRSAALGVYARLDTVGGPASYFTLWQLDNGTGSCKNGANKWSVVRGDPTQPSSSTNFPSGTSSYQTFVLTGTVDSIESNMRQLYSQGY